MRRNEIRDCPACNGGDSDILFEELGYPIARCVECGFVFLGRLPTESPWDKYERRRYHCPEKDRLFRKHCFRLRRLAKTKGFENLSVSPRLAADFPAGKDGDALVLAAAGLGKDEQGG
jgi:Zn ribbon nucleic-acid-binding protein